MPIGRGLTQALSGIRRPPPWASELLRWIEVWRQAELVRLADVVGLRQVEPLGHVMHQIRRTESNGTWIIRECPLLPLRRLNLFDDVRAPRRFRP